MPDALLHQAPQLLDRFKIVVPCKRSTTLLRSHTPPSFLRISMAADCIVPSHPGEENVLEGPRLEASGGIIPGAGRPNWKFRLVPRLKLESGNPGNPARFR